ncbi:hypothetical protein [Aquipseudomonas alcaligenes]|uniref:Glycine zipper domain-containing protein n=1 Tax=Aquipseudomonas alcaligenes TaxID=43263 RepID=A0A1N6Q996_AQUAC|nr:hypothetical protein [Pseudomonas alcaligenes]SIQ13214.1 hypothetical protein SAMN05878282_102313 [Pseudomonas alcaligenes]
MKHLALLAFTTGLLAMQSLQAAEVVAEREENAVGTGFGGLTGLMVGAAAGGPVGAVVGVAVGGWSGAQVQRASGQSGTAYRVRDEAGEERWVRSPQRRFERGQQVDLRQGRLYPH